MRKAKSSGLDANSLSSSAAISGENWTELLILLVRVLVRAITLLKLNRPVPSESNNRADAVAATKACCHRLVRLSQV
ncbi:MAG: hypothetical protein AB1489_33555 [Acidobacteriota bacterium]